MLTIRCIDIKDCSECIMNDSESACWNATKFLMFISRLYSIEYYKISISHFPTNLNKKPTIRCADIDCDSCPQNIDIRPTYTLCNMAGAFERLLDKLFNTDVESRNAPVNLGIDAP